jgi:hypothetical protein
MSSSTLDLADVRATSAHATDESLIVELADGRAITVPLGWYPRLQHGTTEERANWRLIGEGTGIHWPDLDEDLRVEDLLRGVPSAESPASLRKWLGLRSGSSGG